MARDAARDKQIYALRDRLDQELPHRPHARRHPADRWNGGSRCAARNGMRVFVRDRNGARLIEMRGTTEPRRRPRQARARATVEAILTAAGILLVERGWAACTTNHVAERAGVSIGSLYKYFPNKEAIVAEVARLRIAEEVEAIGTALAVDGDPRTTLEQLVVAMIARYVANARLDTVLLEQLGELAMREQLRAGEAQVVHATSAYFARHRIAAPEGAFVLVHALRGVLVAAAGESPSTLKTPAFRAQMIALMTRFCFP
jgi:AcrR family transcriptional regulator